MNYVWSQWNFSETLTTADQQQFQETRTQYQETSHVQKQPSITEQHAVQQTAQQPNYIHQTIIQEVPSVKQSVQVDQGFQQQVPIQSSNQQSQQYQQQYVMQQPQSGFQPQPQIVQQPQTLYQETQPQIFQQSGFQNQQSLQQQPRVIYNQQQSYDYRQPTSAVQPWGTGQQNLHGNNMNLNFHQNAQASNQIYEQKLLTKPQTPKPTQPSLPIEFRGHTPATSNFKNQPIVKREPAGEISPHIKVQEAPPEGVEPITTTPTTTSTTTTTTTTTAPPTTQPPTRPPTRPPTTLPPSSGFMNRGMQGMNNFYPANNIYKNQQTQNTHYQNTNTQFRQTQQNNHIQSNQVYRYNTASSYQPRFITRQQMFTQTTPAPIIYQQPMIQQNNQMMYQQQQQQRNTQPRNSFFGQTQQVQIQSLDLNIPIKSQVTYPPPVLLSSKQQQQQQQQQQLLLQQQQRHNQQASQQLQQQRPQQVNVKSQFRQQQQQFTIPPANQGVQYQRQQSSNLFSSALMGANFGQANINLANNLGTNPGQYQQVQASSDVSWYYSVSTPAPNVVPTEPFPTQPLLDLNLKLYENPNLGAQSNSTVKTRPQPCADVDIRCPQWAQWCGIDEYVDNNCRKLCKNCR